MNLGNLIASLEQEAHSESALEALGDIVLLTEVREMGTAFGEDVGAYVATSARRYAALAGDEEWVTLIGAMERASDPGKMALKRMLRWALDRDTHEIQHANEPPSQGCSCGGKHACGG